MIKANVCASRPTPMKDKKRTRHSTTASSSSSCGDRRGSDRYVPVWCLIDERCLFLSEKPPPAFSLMTARVVSAMLRMTGVQSSFPVEDSRLSIAPFMMSIPEDRQGDGAVREVFRIHRWVPVSWDVPMGRETVVIPRYRTWNFCTSSVFGMGNSADRTEASHQHRSPAGALGLKNSLFMFIGT